MSDLIHLKDIASAITLKSAYEKDGRNLLPADCDILQNVSIICSKDEIIYVGNEKTVIESLKTRIKNTVNLENFSITPEIVDSHTHLIFGGDRSDEYIQRINGVDYQIIANNGGGINLTSQKTNSLNKDELFEISKKRIEKVSQYGIGTIEIKSGYGLNINKEIELSKIIDRLKKHFYPRVKIINTFMAAHAVPKNYTNSHDYMKAVCIPTLEKLSKLKIIDFVDIFHEDGYFSEIDVRLLHEIATKNGLRCRIHADEFVDNNGACIAAELNFYSADHLLAISDKGINALSKSSTVATLLPGTGYFLGKQQAPARRILDKGCKVAIASDYNPGSCHIDNLLLIANIAAPNYKINQCELWSAITLNPSHSLGLKKQGAIIKGLAPRFSFFETRNINQINYSWTQNYSRRIEEVDQFFF